jgi:hypothetical protein
MLLVLACTSSAKHRTSIAAAVPVCGEADRGAWSSGAEVVIPDDPAPPCRLILDTAVLRSYSAVEADSLDLARVRAVDRQGNVYVQGYTPGVITVLSPTGDRINRIGHAGPGPGELPRGALGVDVSDRDSIYISDNRLRWSVFAPNGRFVRTIPLGAIEAGVGRRCVLADGTVISAAALRGGIRPATLRLVAPDGEIRTEFGHPRREEAATASLPRGVNCGRDGAVWALPSPLEPGYRLERWGPGGALENTVIRDAAWFIVGPPMTRTEGMGTRPSSTVRQVVELRRGLLLTTVVTADPRWHPVTRDEWEAHQAELYDVRFEALDAMTGRLLAVLRVDDQASLPNARAMRDGRSYELVVDDSGDAHLMAYTFHLVDR